MHEVEKAELGKIDYLLDELARAVERGDVPLSCYTSLAPGYLARRAELVAVMTGERQSARATPPQPASATALQPASGGAPEPGSVTSPKLTAGPHERASAHRLNWTTVLLFTGVFLAIIATAAFALSAWESVGPGIRAGALGLVTLGFYAAGERVRSRLGMPVGGAALTSVGSAMLLFDGWIVIDGFNLAGAWPWAAWFAACSVVYWLTEVRYGGRAFGVLGGVAQIAWWWLLGSGFGWDTSIRLALIALVMLGWSLSARQLKGHPGLDQFASLLGPLARTGSVLAVLASVVAMSVQGGLVALVCAATVGWSATFVLYPRSARRQADQHPAHPGGQSSFASFWYDHPGMGALCHLPFLATLVLSTTFTWWEFALVGAMTCTYAVYELWRGGTGFGILALLAEFSLVPILFVLCPSWDESAVSGAFALLALSWMLESVLLVREAETAQVGRTPTWFVAHAVPYAKLATVAAWVLLVVSSLVLLGTSEIALVGVWASARTIDVVSAAVIMLCWFGAAALKREPGAFGAMVVSGVLLALVLDAAHVSWAPSLRALPYVALAVAWAAGAPAVERTTALSSVATRMVARVFVPCVVLVAVLADVGLGNFPSWQEALLLGVVAACYAVDALVSRSPVLLAITALFAVAAVGVFGGWHAGVPGMAIGGGACALVCALASAAIRRPRDVATWAPWAATGAGLVVALSALGAPGSLAIALALVAFACASACVSSRKLELLTLAGTLALAATLALLAHVNDSQWLTVAVLALASLAFLAPALLTHDAVPASDRVGRALGRAGLISAAALVLVAAAGPLGASMPEWASLGQSAFAVSFAMLGTALLAYFIAFDGEATLYAGVGAFVVACWIGLDATTSPRIEWFSTLGGAYLIWCGYRWASRDPGRSVPRAADIGAVAVALGVPALALLDPGAPPSAEWAHTWWALGLGIAAIGAGRAFRVRTYFFGGIALVAWLAVVRSWAEWWWLVLFVVGTAMIVFVVAREWRQRMIEDVRDTLGTWR